jgi:carboxymethylenebutenolidase
MGHWATKDEFFGIGKVDELEKELRGANVKFEFHRYDAKHAFANETAVGPKRPVAAAEYNAQAAELAWKRTLEFFAKNLK